MMEKGHPQGKEKWRFIWGGGKRFPLLNYHVLSPMHQQINWLVRMSSPVLLHWAWRREFFLGFGLFKFSHWNIDRQSSSRKISLAEAWTGVGPDEPTVQPPNRWTVQPIRFSQPLILGFNMGIFQFWIWASIRASFNFGFGKKGPLWVKAHW